MAAFFSKCKQLNQTAMFERSVMFKLKSETLRFGGVDGITLVAICSLMQVASVIHWQTTT